MRTDSDQLSDELLERTVRLQRVASGFERRIRDSLAGLRKSVLSELPSHWRADVVLRSGFAQMRAELEAQLREVADRESRFAGHLLGASYVDGADIYAAPVMGAALGDWLDKIEDDLAFRVESETRRQYATDPEAPARRDFLMAAFTAAIAGLVSLARTFVQAMLNRAVRLAAKRTVQAAQWQQISVLDARTTQICRLYAFKKWDSNFQPVGHKLPFYDGVPRHWYCRSVIVPLFSSKMVEIALPGWLGGGRGERLFGSRALALFERGQMTLADLVRQSARPLNVSEV